MLDAKTRFKEGYVMLLRPFQFADLENPIQQLTIAYGYSEQPYFKEILNEKSKIKLEAIQNRTKLEKAFDPDDEEGNLLETLIVENKQNYDQIYLGEIIQITIDNKVIKLYPKEYNIISDEKLINILAEPGYHTIVYNKQLLNLKAFNDKRHYLQSRGISKDDAIKWASIGFKDFVYYKPYFELLNLFVRSYDIYPDHFYEKIENVTYEDQLKMNVKIQKRINTFSLLN